LRNLRAALIGHLEEQQISQLLNVIAIIHAVMAQCVAEAPEFLDDIGHDSLTTDYTDFADKKRRKSLNAETRRREEDAEGEPPPGLKGRKEARQQFTANDSDHLLIRFPFFRDLRGKIFEYSLGVRTLKRRI